MRTHFLLFDFDENLCLFTISLRAFVAFVCRVVIETLSTYLSVYRRAPISSYMPVAARVLLLS